MNLELEKRIADLITEINGRIESVQAVVNSSFDTYYIVNQCNEIQKMVSKLVLLEEMAEAEKVPCTLSYN